MAQEYFESGHEIRSMLRTLFNSDHFKSQAVRLAQVKSPVELVVGTLRTARAFEWPTPDIRGAALAVGYMGQELLNPPNVEGWHEGIEWIDSGALIERINFAANYLGDIQQPGIRAIIERLASMDGGVLAPEEVVDNLLDLIGPVRVSDSTRRTLVSHVARDGDVDLRDATERGESERRVAQLLGLIASTREFQMC